VVPGDYLSVVRREGQLYRGAWSVSNHLGHFFEFFSSVAPVGQQGHRQGVRDPPVDHDGRRYPNVKSYAETPGVAETIRSPDVKPGAEKSWYNRGMPETAMTLCCPDGPVTVTVPCPPRTR